jgi:hypothetical protein
MDVTLREIRMADVAECGRICFEAFSAIARQHDFPSDFLSAEVNAGAVGCVRRRGEETASITRRVRGKVRSKPLASR